MPFEAPVTIAVLDLFAIQQLLSLRRVAESSLVFPFSGDPFPDVCRATAELDAARLTVDEESNRVHVHERQFIHLEHYGALTRSDLSLQLR
jgi:hypothetical protein